MKYHLLIFFSFAIFTRCLEQQEIDLPSAPPRIVIDAVVSNIEGESYVDIGWSSVVNASEDNVGNRPDVGPFKINGNISIVEKESGTEYNSSFKMKDKKGMISLRPSLIGMPGADYLLVVTIDYEGKTEVYSAEATMHATPAISEISYEIRKGDIGKNDNLVPLISFIDPEGENYYLFQLCAINRNTMYCGSSRVWPYSVLADTFLPTYIQNLSIDDGASVVRYTEFYPSPEPGAGAHVRMYAIDKITYEFYRSLISQFNNDGGAFSPTPATPKGNISGNGVGLFRAIAESSATVYYQ